MKPFFAVTVVLSAVSAASASPTDRAILAAMRLSESPNYSWSSVVTDDAQTYNLEGRTKKNGYTWMRLPMVKSIAQRLGRMADTDIEAVFAGNGASVIRTDDGWRMLGELPKRHRDWGDDDYWVGPIVRSSRGSFGATPIFDPFEPPIIVLHNPPPDNEDRGPYTNAQFAVSRPHEELAVLVSSCPELKVEGDVVSGLLTDMGAQLLLVREGQDHLNPLRAAGAFTMQIKDDVVMKYQVRLEGILLVDRKRVHVRQLASTTIRNIGATQVEVDDDARRRLDVQVATTLEGR